MQATDAKVGHHYIDTLGRVVVAVPERRGCCGCTYSHPYYQHCARGERPLDTNCWEIIFVEVTDEDTH